MFESYCRGAFPLQRESVFSEAVEPIGEYSEEASTSWSITAPESQLATEQPHGAFARHLRLPALVDETQRLKDVEYCSAGVGARYNTSLECDKSLFSLSVLGRSSHHAAQHRWRQERLAAQNGVISVKNWGNLKNSLAAPIPGAERQAEAPDSRSSKRAEVRCDPWLVSDEDRVFDYPVATCPVVDSHRPGT